MVKFIQPKVNGKVTQKAIVQPVAIKKWPIHRLRPRG
ncbi:hypothetical protein FHW88_003651 [Mucilaginibacter sp. SG538B]|nr:hypothetical protein [Mucilaginibacter sp. SG538B]